ncbi:MAG: DUF3592 domain-containing protein [Planctomycetota bacterium]|nr:DUF3592 domain-containing protein [Planctomycetota bacterium]
MPGQASDQAKPTSSEIRSALIWLVVGLITLAAVTYWATHSIRKRVARETTFARITKVESEPLGWDEERGLQVKSVGTYEFTVDQRQYRGRVDPHPDTHKVGHRLEVAYDANDPSSNCTVSSERTFIVDVLLLLAGFYVAYAMLRPNLRVLRRRTRPSST